jgi:hypothetical protein
VSESRLAAVAVTAFYYVHPFILGE